jgi:D-aspartate ligase
VPTASGMRLAHTERDLLQVCGSILESSSSNLMLQEYIPGGDEMTWTFNGYFDRHGECLLAFTGRKLRNYPPYFGMGCLGVCANNEEVKQMTLAFMKSIGYRGGLDIGYRYDFRDGRYKVNDINPRIGAMFRLFVGQNGVDIARAIYQDMIGEQVVSAPTRDGRKWIVEDCDYSTALRYCRDGILTFGGWLDSIRGVDELSYVAGDDLWPLAAVFVSKVKSFRNRIRRLISAKPSERKSSLPGGERIAPAEGNSTA